MILRRIGRSPRRVAFGALMALLVIGNGAAGVASASSAHRIVAGTVTVSGAVGDGTELVAHTARWTPAAGRHFSCSWYVAGKRVRGANACRFAPTQGQATRRISVQVTAHAPKFAPATAMSAAVVPHTPVHLLVGLGQSNMEGQGGPLTAALDRPVSGIQMWNWVSNRLATASIPLSSPHPHGFSPLSEIGMQTYLHADHSEPIVLLDAARSGSGLVTATKAGSWAVGYRGSKPRAYSSAVQELDRTLAAIAKKYRNAPVDLHFYWIQGESDAGTPRTTYTAALVKLVDSLRAHVGDNAIPFTIGGMVPEHTAATAGLPAIRSGLLDTVRRLDYSAYVDGPAGGGDNLGAGSIHYTRQALEQLGDSMYAAGRRAEIAGPRAIPEKPLGVTASYVLGTLTVKWQAPLCRYTGFEVQYRRSNGAAWTTWLSAPNDTPTDTTRTVGHLPAGTYQVRVATVDHSVATPFAPPVYALHA